MSRLMLLFLITAVFVMIITTLAVLLIKNMRSYSRQSKYAAQQEDEEKTCVYFPLNLNPSVLIAFKKTCTENHTTHTAEMERYIVSYCKEHGTNTPEE